MLRLARYLGNLMPRSSKTRAATRRPKVQRLELEALEPRALAAVVSGVVFLDHTGDGVFNAGDQAFPGKTVMLSGTTTGAESVNVGVTTDTNGRFQFTNVFPGTYQLQAGAVQALLSGGGSVNLSLSEGQSVTQSFAFGGVAPAAISLRLFLTNATTGLPFPTQPAGSGQTSVDKAPVVSSAIANVSVLMNASETVIDLAGNFSDPDITRSQIRFDTNAGQINATLFDTTAPRTVANFFNYITSNRFDSSIFHRLAITDGAKFVLQGGGFNFADAGGSGTLPPVQTDPSVQNEFGASNLIGTMAMAKQGGDPNSATSQFFFNLGDNSANLDKQNGGFTVFGKIDGPADQSVIDTLTSAPVTPQTGFSEIPLNNYTGSNFPTDTTAANYDLVQDIAIVSRNEVLAYSVVGNNNSSLVTASIDNNRLTLQYATDQVGTATITVQATDRFGLTVQASFTVTVS